MRPRLPLPGPIFLMAFLLFSACNNPSPPPVPKETPNSSPAPVKAAYTDVNEISAERLAMIGAVLVFGTEKPEFGGGGVPIGKAQCPLCHMFLPDQRADRAPVLVGLEVRSHKRVKEERYKMFAARLATGDPNTGIVPHAQTGGEYILESEYCPACYVPEGFGIKGTNDLVSPMPIMNRPPTSLTDFELVAIAAYIQMKDTPGDYSKVTAVKDWEHSSAKRCQ